MKIQDFDQESILLTEPVLNPQKKREKMAEVMFEKFGFDRLQIRTQAVLSLFAEGLESGLLLDSGDGVTHVVPIYNQTPQKEGILRLNLGGRHITQQLIRKLFLKGYAFNSSADFQIAKLIKEKFCFVSGDLEVDRKLARETTIHEKEYKLPDNSLIKIGKERFEAPEILFNPFLGGYEFDGIGEIVYKSIQNCKIDTRKTLFDNIVISGGNTLYPGFPTRLLNEVKKIYRTKQLQGDTYSEIDIDINIIDPARRRYNVFIGAGIIANTTNDIAEIWTSKYQWEEEGTQSLQKLD